MSGPETIVAVGGAKVLAEASRWLCEVSCKAETFNAQGKLILQSKRVAIR